VWLEGLGKFKNSPHRVSPVTFQFVALTTMLPHLDRRVSHSQRGGSPTATCHIKTHKLQWRKVDYFFPELLLLEIKRKLFYNIINLYLQLAIRVVRLYTYLLLTTFPDDLQDTVSLKCVGTHTPTLLLVISKSGAKKKKKSDIQMHIS
jgi:hypothetical protein